MAKLIKSKINNLNLKNRRGALTAPFLLIKLFKINPLNPCFIGPVLTIL
jgi:hypothetical protein